MAQQVSVSFVDDIDGSEAEGTVTFGVEGKTYEIDLSEANASKLRDVLAPYVGAARRAGGSSRDASKPAAAKSDRKENQAIRAWAAEQGMSVSARGRISTEVADTYKARGSKPAVVEAPVVVEPEPEVAEVPVKKPRKSRAKAVKAADE